MSNTSGVKRCNVCVSVCTFANWGHTVSVSNMGMCLTNSARKVVAQRSVYLEKSYCDDKLTELD